MASPKLTVAIDHLDALHALDPARTMFEGEEIPVELLYAQRMTAQLLAIDPGASEALQLAVRAQHLGRFLRPRSDYPDGRAGYRRWRSDAATHHAEAARKILTEVGYAEDLLGRVESLIKKEGLTSDLEAQLLEDVACLVFLEHELEAFALKQTEAKVLDILRKTAKKMSARGLTEAKRLKLSDRSRSLLLSALGQSLGQAW